MSTGGVDQLSEKMNKLDTLSGGVVFGKEEAWDKLQARIEAKPKKIALGFRFAAAAALLLVIIIAGLYNYTRDEANVISAAPVTEPIQQSNDSSRELLQQIAVTATPHQEHRIIIVNKKTKVYETIETVILPQEQVAMIEKPVEIHESIPAPATPLVKEMKVVHINDAERNVANDISLASKPQGIDISRLPVMHITDVELEAVQARTILRETRVTFGRTPFSRQVYYSDYAPPSEQYHQPRNLLKNIFNTQN